MAGNSNEYLNDHEMSFVGRNLSLGLPTRFDTNRAVQPQEMARSLKFRIKEVGNCTIHVAKTKQS